MIIDESLYQVENAEQIESPALLYYEDIIRANTVAAIKNAGGARRLWPHVKSHKMSAMVRMQMDMGITRFKCATIAEAEMLAGCGAEDILLAYPLVGPNIMRFITLAGKYRGSRFWAIGDDLGQISILEKESAALRITIKLLVDVNLGMNRTGVPLNSLEEFCRLCSLMGQGISVQGFHCYDGHNNAPDRSIRDESAKQAYRNVSAIRTRLEGDGIPLDTIIMGGTPSFPCYCGFPDVYLSPGTIFLSDYGYASKYPDLKYTPGAVVMSRVISHPAPGIFTLDAGSKALAADPAGVRGVIAGYEDDTEPISQSEEHWTFRMKENDGSAIPPIGTVLYIIPTHICPTSALYRAVLTVKEMKVSGAWEVTARNRRLTY